MSDVEDKLGLAILAGDVMAVELTRLLNHIALGGYERFGELKSALHTYTEVRFDGIMQGYAPSDVSRRYIMGNSDPQCCQLNDPAPATERCVHHALTA